MVSIERVYTSAYQTIGILKVYNDSGGVQCAMWVLELPDKQNERSVSRIPAGTYDVVRWNSPSKGDCFKVKSPGYAEVNGRSHILIHKGNYNKDTLGCILPGLGVKDINLDGHQDVTDSSGAMELLKKLKPDGFKLTIV